MQAQAHMHKDRTRHQKKLVWLIFVLSKLWGDSMPWHLETASKSCKTSQGKVSHISHILISEDRATVILYAHFYFYSYLLSNLNFTSRWRKSRTVLFQLKTFFKNLAAVFFDLLPCLCWTTYQVSCHSIPISVKSVFSPLSVMINQKSFHFRRQSCSLLFWILY